MNTPSGVSQPPEKSGSAAPPSALARLLKTVAAVEALEVKAVLLSMLYFFFLFGSYSVIKPVRDAMGTVYGVKHLQELFTVTFIASLIFAPLYAGLASRLKLSTFLPWVYGFIAVTILVFYAMFVSGRYPDRWIAAAFYVWVSTFNMLIISVFWTFMADIFSRAQAKRLFGFIAAGGTIGGIVGPAIATFLAKGVGNNGLMLIAAGGFVVTAVLVTLLAKEKEKDHVDSDRARLGVGHRQRDLHVGQPAGEDPAAVVEGAAVDYLDDHLDVARAEEPEVARVCGQRNGGAVAARALGRDTPVRLHPKTHAVQAQTRRIREAGARRDPADRVSVGEPERPVRSCGDAAVVIVASEQGELVDPSGRADPADRSGVIGEPEIAVRTAA